MNDVDIILPVHNEKDILLTVLREWASVLNKMNISYSFVICEDGSTDGTKKLLLKLQKAYPIHLNQASLRRGYGRAVLDGIASSNGTYVLCIDSDGQCDPRDFHTFWKLRHKNKVIIGWRLTRMDTWIRILYSRLFHVLFSLLFFNRLHDPSTPFVLFQKKSILPYVHYLTYLHEGFWWGFIGTCLKFSISVMELPIHHRARLKGKTQIYSLKRMPSLAMRNIVGLFALRFAKKYAFNKNNIFRIAAQGNTRS